MLISKTQHMNRYINCLALLSSLFCSVSCKKFLDVKPVDEFLEATVYNSETSINSAITGIYMNMANEGLYGGNLTATTIDVLAQYYSPDNLSNTDFRNVVNFSYGEQKVKEKFSAIWEQSYRNVLNINVLLEKISAAPSTVLADSKKEVLRGEMYALRAMHHFDLLRVFGPVMAAEPSEVSIPYYNGPSKAASPLLPATAVLDKVLADLDSAISKLGSDPVRTEGVKPLSGTDVFADFYKLRNHRMNYFSALALKARVALYKNDKALALKCAQQVIDEATPYFPWSPAAASLPGIKNPDRIFSSEILFGIENTNLYTLQRNYFNAGIVAGDLLAPTSDKLTSVYDYSNDFRYRSSWILDQSSNKDYKTFYKFAEVTDRESPVRYFQPLIRISEMYYIAAECTSDATGASVYLNRVRVNRGLPGITAVDDISTELTKEYAREFWGEGQLFFYYKRNNFPAIPDPLSPDATIPMGKKQYKIPLPDSETHNR